MNILVKHNGDTITSSVLSYERVHEICTGIGTLTIEIERTIGRNFDPWDSIDIHENGDFKVRYYISAVRDDIPQGKITLDCQDLSKKLVDFFIPESYTIEEPSYTRYWIELFLDMAGVNYDFETSSPGNLLSNHTQLGLVPAYEQILTLLQLSGWYMFFDGNGTAIIGPLETNLADTAGSVDGDDILSISKVSDDKMLRNRALVLGTFDIYTMSYASADVSVHTRWNYDRNDIRSMVVSNSNIPNKGSAYKIANMLLKEFARITEEKRIELHGARDYTLGEALRVNSRVWRGKGLITTFGVRMTKDGLITDVILDQRCPRLFGFFDFGDYVYVGTYGDGVWRKHLKFDPTWYNFSDGLTDLNITDLHINNGVFGAVASGGEMYYRSSEDSGAWSQVTVTGLMSSLENTVASGMPVTYVGFSGLKGRATIVDKLGNTVKFAIDTTSGWNNGDYFLDWYPSGILFSGISLSGVAASGVRSWIVEYDPFTGNPVGTLGSGIYPVQYSGNYALQVVDLENDGVNDYISVASAGESIPNEGTNWDFGDRANQPFASTKDYNTYSVAPSSASYVNDSESISRTFNTFNRHSLVAIDDAVNGVRKAVVFGKDRRCRLTNITQESDGTFSTTTVTSPVSSDITSSHVVLGIYPDWFLDEYTVYYRNSTVLSNDSFFKSVWDVSTNTWSSQTVVGTQNLLTPNGIDATFSDSVLINGKIYNLRYYVSVPATVGGFRLSPSYLYVYLDVIDIQFSTFSEFLLLEFLTTDDNLDGRYDYFPGSPITSDESLGTFNRINFGIFQKNNGIQILGWATVRRQAVPSRNREYVFVGNESVINYGLIYDDPNIRFETGTSNLRSQLTLEGGFIGRQTGTSGHDEFAFNGDSFVVTTSTGTLSAFKDPGKIFPILNGADIYIVAHAGDFYVYEASTMSLISQITEPTDYVLSKPFSTPVKFVEDEIYFSAFELPSFEGVYLPFSTFDLDFNMTTALKPDNVILSNFRAVNFGGFFISEPADYTVATPVTLVHYIDMGTPDYGGSTFLVLQREGSEFNLIQRASYPIRLDISNSTPLLTVGSGFNTFVSNYISNGELEVIFPTVGSGVGFVEDYRYTLLEPAYGEVPSGLGVQMMGVYVHGSGVYATDVRTYSGGWLPFYDIPSGWGNLIETSNYGLGGQYMFVTSSGFVQMFFQKNPEEVAFTAYSGMPQSRATIIRLDDRM